MKPKQKFACPDLRQLFADRYRIQHEESYYAEESRCRGDEDAWLQVIPCRHGHIFPWGCGLLAASTSRRGPIAARLRSLPFVEVVQDGDDGSTVTFPVESFDQVAGILAPKRKRSLRPETRSAAIERLRAFRFCKSHAGNDAPDDLKRALTGSVDAEHAL